MCASYLQTIQSVQTFQTGALLSDSLRLHLNVCAPSLSGADLFMKGVQCFTYRHFRAVKATERMFHKN